MAKRKREKLSTEEERQLLKDAKKFLGCKTYMDLSKKINVSESTIKQIMSGDSQIRSGWKFASLLMEKLKYDYINK